MKYHFVLSRFADALKGQKFYEYETAAAALSAENSNNWLSI